MDKKQLYMIDYIKVLAAICVVAIHTKLDNNIFLQIGKDIYAYIVSLAVPFFFTISGYLLASKLGKIEDKKVQKNIILKEIRKYLKLYIMLSFLYLPLTVYGWILNSIEGKTVIKNVILLIRGYLVMGEQFYSWPLWYLWSSVLALMVIYKIELLNRKLICLCVGSFLLSLSVNCLSVSPAIKYTIGSGRIFTGLSYILVGFIVYRWNDKLSNRWGYIFITTAIVVSVVFHLEYSTTNISAFMTVPWLVWGGGIKYNGYSIIALKAREISKIIYYIHMYFSFLWVYDIFKFKEIRTHGIKMFIFVLFTSLCTAIIWDIMKKRYCRMRNFLKDYIRKGRS